MILDFLNKKKEKEQRILKMHAIRKAVVQFYEDLNNANGSINIPAFLQAKKVLSERIKTPKDIDYIYKKLLKYQQAV